MMGSAAERTDNIINYSGALNTSEEFIENTVIASGTLGPLNPYSIVSSASKQPVTIGSRLIPGGNKIAGKLQLTVGANHPKSKGGSEDGSSSAFSVDYQAMLHNHYSQVDLPLNNNKVSTTAVAATSSNTTAAVLPNQVASNASKIEQVAEKGTK